MKLNEIFLKDVTRSIEGVVKADDVDHLGVEVEEYVFTNDAAKGVAPLLEEYTNYTNANGVWISGFFGSGKSHLLKMLAHLLGDVEGQAFPREQLVVETLEIGDVRMVLQQLGDLIERANPGLLEEGRVDRANVDLLGRLRQVRRMVAAALVGVARQENPS